MDRYDNVGEHLPMEVHNLHNLHICHSLGLCTDTHGPLLLRCLRSHTFTFMRCKFDEGGGTEKKMRPDKESTACETNDENNKDWRNPRNHRWSRFLL